MFWGSTIFNRESLGPFWLQNACTVSRIKSLAKICKDHKDHLSMDGQTVNDFQKVLGRTSGHHSRSKQFQVISSQHGLENGEEIVCVWGGGTLFCVLSGGCQAWSVASRKWLYVFELQ